MRTSPPQLFGRGGDCPHGVGAYARRDGRRGIRRAGRGEGEEKISPPRSFLKVGAYGICPIAVPPAVFHIFNYHFCLFNNFSQGSFLKKDKWEPNSGGSVIITNGRYEGAEGEARGSMRQRGWVGVGEGYPILNVLSFEMLMVTSRLY